MRLACLILLSAMIVTLAGAAEAQIGKITIPPPKEEVKESPKESPNESPAVAVETKKIPVVTLTFNKRRVYFQRELRQALGNSESRGAGAGYEVVSKVKPGLTREKNLRLNVSTESNLNDVVLEMQKLGVPGSRISVRSETDDTVNGQVIEIYRNPLAN